MGDVWTPGDDYDDSGIPGGDGSTDPPYVPDDMFDDGDEGGGTPGVGVMSESIHSTPQFSYPAVVGTTCSVAGELEEVVEVQIDDELVYLPFSTRRYVPNIPTPVYPWPTAIPMSWTYNNFINGIIRVEMGFLTNSTRTSSTLSLTSGLLLSRLLDASSKVTPCSMRTLKAFDGICFDLPVVLPGPATSYTARGGFIGEVNQEPTSWEDYGGQCFPFGESMTGFMYRWKAQKISSKAYRIVLSTMFGFNDRYDFETGVAHTGFRPRYAQTSSWNVSSTRNATIENRSASTVLGSHAVFGEFDPAKTEEIVVVDMGLSFACRSIEAPKNKSFTWAALLVERTYQEAGNLDDGDFEICGYDVFMINAVGRKKIPYRVVDSVNSVLIVGPVINDSRIDFYEAVTGALRSQSMSFPYKESTSSYACEGHLMQLVCSQWLTEENLFNQRVSRLFHKTSFSDVSGAGSKIVQTPHTDEIYF